MLRRSARESGCGNEEGEKANAGAYLHLPFTSALTSILVVPAKKMLRRGRVSHIC